jgi:hypothetical protein
MSLVARYKGVCKSCGKPIEVGQVISWSRREKGTATHADCAMPDAKPEPKTPVVDMSALQSIIEAAIAKMAVAKVIPKESVDVAEVFAEVLPEACAKPEPKKLKAITLGSLTTVKENAPWFDLLKQLTASFSGGLLRVLLIGPPGTGKSKTSLVLTDTPYRVTMTEGMGVEDLIGMYQLIKGETVWVDGPVIRAMREGKRILIDEVDHHPTEVGSLLYAFLDDSPEIMLPTGEKVTAKLGYGVIATTNSNVTALPEAVLDRFEAILPAIVPHPDALVQFSDNAMRDAVSNHFLYLDRTPWFWSGKPTLRRMAAFARLKEVIGEGNAASLAFGNAGKELLAVMGTASRTGKKEGL